MGMLMVRTRLARANGLGERGRWFAGVRGALVGLGWVGLGMYLVARDERVGVLQGRCVEYHLEA